MLVDFTHIFQGYLQTLLENSGGRMIASVTLKIVDTHIIWIHKKTDILTTKNKARQQSVCVFVEYIGTPKVNKGLSQLYLHILFKPR